MNITIKSVSKSLEKIAIRDAINHIIQFTSDITKYKEGSVIKRIYNECREKYYYFSIQLLHILQKKPGN